MTARIAALGLVKNEVARVAGVRKNTFYNWLSGRQSMNASYVACVLAAIGLGIREDAGLAKGLGIESMTPRAPGRMVGKLDERGEA